MSRGVETELRHGYSGPARRKVRQQTSHPYRHRATTPTLPRCAALQSDPKSALSRTGRGRHNGGFPGFATDKDVFVSEDPGQKPQAGRMQGLEPRPQAIAGNPG
jgi:hypothetical protein